MAAGDFLRLRDRSRAASRRWASRPADRCRRCCCSARRPAGARSKTLISVTPDTSTSVRLLELLLKARGFTGTALPARARAGQADGLLLIGDKAMQTRNRPPEGFRAHARPRLGLARVDGTAVRVRRCGSCARRSIPRSVTNARVPRIVARRRTRHAAGSRAAVERAGLDSARGRGVPAPLPVPLRSRGTQGDSTATTRLREHGFVESATDARAAVRDVVLQHAAAPLRNPA